MTPATSVGNYALTLPSTVVRRDTLGSNVHSSLVTIILFIKPVTGIGPVSSAWKADILPLNYTDKYSQWTRRNTKPPPVADVLP